MATPVRKILTGDPELAAKWLDYALIRLRQIKAAGIPSNAFQPELGVTVIVKSVAGHDSVIINAESGGLYLQVYKGWNGAYSGKDRNGETHTIDLVDMEIWRSIDNGKNWHTIYEAQVDRLMFKPLDLDIVRSSDDQEHFIDEAWAREIGPYVYDSFEIEDDYTVFRYADGSFNYADGAVQPHKNLCDRASRINSKIGVMLFNEYGKKDKSSPYNLIIDNNISPIKYTKTGARLFGAFPTGLEKPGYGLATLEYLNTVDSEGSYHQLTYRGTDEDVDVWLETGEPFLNLANFGFNSFPRNEQHRIYNVGGKLFYWTAVPSGDPLKKSEYDLYTSTDGGFSWVYEGQKSIETYVGPGNDLFWGIYFMIPRLCPVIQVEDETDPENTSRHDMFIVFYNYEGQGPGNLWFVRMRYDKGAISFYPIMPTHDLDPSDGQATGNFSAQPMAMVFAKGGALLALQWNDDTEAEADPHDWLSYRPQWTGLYISHDKGDTWERQDNEFIDELHNRGKTGEMVLGGTLVYIGPY